MGMFSHLGGMALGTVKEGASKNMGSVIVSQTAAHVFGANATVTTACIIPAGAQIINIHSTPRPPTTQSPPTPSSSAPRRAARSWLLQLTSQPSVVRRC
jgi:hypothetical protein